MFLRIILIVFTFNLPNNILAQTIDPVNAKFILERYIQAMSPGINIEKIRDKLYTWKGLVHSAEVTFTIKQKIPNKFYQELKISTLNQKTYFNGKNGYQVILGRAESLSDKANELLEIQSEMFLQKTYERFNIELEFAAIDSVDGRKAYKIILHLPIGVDVVQYYDTENFLLLKQVNFFAAGDNFHSQSFEYRDYKLINGVMIPSKIIHSFEGNMLELKLESFEYNTGIGDSIFEPF